MAQAGTIAISRFKQLLVAETGLTTAMKVLADFTGSAADEILERQVTSHQIAFDLEEKTAGAKYPSFHIYCDRISNTLREKFRTFSGTVQLNAEVRVSQDRLDGIDTILHRHVDGLTYVLDQNRGDWGSGMHYAGGYDITFQPIKHGGKNFLQSAKITFAVHVSL